MQPRQRRRQLRAFPRSVKVHKHVAQARERLVLLLSREDGAGSLGDGVLGLDFAKHGLGCRKPVFRKPMDEVVPSERENGNGQRGKGKDVGGSSTDDVMAPALIASTSRVLPTPH